MPDPTIATAFLAGLISFLSPCVLPLVPGYLSYMSGVGVGEGKRVSPLRTGAMAGAFVAGFGAVLVALGATATLLGSFLRDNQVLFARVGGVVIILLGLVFMGVLRIPWLYREARFHPTPRAGLWGSAVLGAAFAFGWTPCIGATLGVVLTMAAGRGLAGGPGEGALLLAVYSLGLGLPFIVAGLGVSYASGTLQWLRRRVRAINLASGAMLILVGILILTEQMTRISYWLLDRVDIWPSF
ncbi:MAG TPA: cytochrome c biogenesis CcdA family protein [Actinomycetota bacterium]|nr:cytochrome c biogenesis CcdA family protein [Actinomycetota bacterium]